MVMKNDIPKSNNLVTNLSKRQNGHEDFSWFLVKARAYSYLGQLWSSAAAGEETTWPRTCWSGKTLTLGLAGELEILCRRAIEFYYREEGVMW